MIVIVSSLAPITLIAAAAAALCSKSSIRVAPLRCWKGNNKRERIKKKRNEPLHEPISGVLILTVQLDGGTHWNTHHWKQSQRSQQQQHSMNGCCCCCQTAQWNTNINSTNCVMHALLWHYYTFCVLWLNSVHICALGPSTSQSVSQVR